MLLSAGLIIYQPSNTDIKSMLVLDKLTSHPKKLGVSTATVHFSAWSITTVFDKFKIKANVLKWFV